MEYTSARGATWREAAGRAARVLLPRRRRRGWSLLVPLIALLAGLLVTTTAHTAAGTALRDDRGPELTRLIQERRAQVAAGAAQAAALRGEIDAATEVQGGSDSGIAAERARANAQKKSAGFTSLHGPGIEVRLDDAPRRPDGGLPAGAGVDDVVVHQQDVQSVVNALWAGGAEAMTIMDVRVISTSAVRCVGNTLLLHGQVYSPPFVVRAIGDPNELRRALDTADGVRAFAGAARAWGLGYEVATKGDIITPGYEGSVDLEHAQVAG